VFAEYHLQQMRDPRCTGPGHSCYEVDHSFDRKNGGADVLKNLWPQRYDGTPWNAHVKDKLEMELAHLVCVENTMTQIQAFNCITSDWISCYQKIFAP
jgi:hypothetical protein